MSSISLTGSLNTCKVDTAWATKEYSDRYFNTAKLMCPMWTGQDVFGRQVCPDSAYLKSPGCNLASDWIKVTNAQRPQYAEFITLNARGIQGGPDCDSCSANDDISNLVNITGSAGLGMRGIYRKTDLPDAYSRRANQGYAQDMNAYVVQNQNKRLENIARRNMLSNSMRAMSGNY